MIHIKDKSECCGCMACEQACPNSCIKMEVDVEGFWYPQIDEHTCIECDLCEKVCPVIKTKVKNQESDDRKSGLLSRETKAYAAINKDDNVRINSSSGGVFSALAEYVLETGGVVFGARFSDDFRKVRHVAIFTKNELELLRGSKYVQSEIGKTYYEAEEYLKSGRMVLFTGTPCQIEGLKSYLKKEYENLLCLDIICHGVPSPKVWQVYVDRHEREAEANTRKMFFRHKKYGWKAYSVWFEFDNNKTYVQKLSEDLYMRAFLKNMCLRPSCYACSFKKKRRISDVTVADFWGIENVASEMDDDKGTSLVVVHSDKGEFIWNKVVEKLVVKEVELDEALRYNPAMISSVTRNRYREEFLYGVNEETFERLVKRYDKPENPIINLLKRIWIRGKRWLKKKSNQLRK